MQISEANRPAAVKVYTDYRQPFLDTIEGALTKDLLVRDEDVQVLHGFDSVERVKGLPGKRPVQRRRRNRLGPYVGRRPQHRRVRGRIAPHPFGAESANLSASLVLARAPHPGALLVWRTPAGEGARRVSVYWISNENAWEGTPLKQYQMRIAEREMSLADTLDVLEEGQFIAVATVDEDGMPYCTPLSYVVERGAGTFERSDEPANKSVQAGETPDGESAAAESQAASAPVCRIYVHTTNTYGHKIDDWKRDGRVCGTVTNEVEPCYEETFFTSRFATAMAFGRIRRVEDSVAVRKALVALCMKYMPSEKAEIGGAIQREFDITDVWCIDVELLTGKAGRRKNR